jgi:hypothetical protein
MSQDEARREQATIIGYLNPGKRKIEDDAKTTGSMKKMLKQPPPGTLGPQNHWLNCY